MSEYSPNAKPDADSIGYCRDMLLAKVQTAWIKFRKWDTYYFRNFQIWDSPNEARAHYWPAKSRAVIDQPADTEFAYKPRFERRPIGREGEPAEVRADELEEWEAAVFAECSLEELSDPDKMFNKDQLRYGYAIGETLWVAQAVADEPVKRPDEDQETYERRVQMWEYDQKNYSPFRRRVPHPCTVLMDMSMKRPDEAVKETKMFTKEIERLMEKKRKYGKATVDRIDLGKPYDEHTVTHYFSKRWQAMMVGGEVLFRQVNPLGVLPYTQAFSGYGAERMDTDMLNDPADKCGSLYEGIDGDLKAFAQQRSANHFVTIRRAYASPRTTQVGSPAATSLEAVQTGRPVEGVGKDDLGWVEYPKVTNDNFQESAIIEKDIAEGTYYPSLSGTKQENVNTLGQQQILSEATTRKFSQISSNQAARATHDARYFLRCVYLYGEDSIVGGKTLTLAHIGGDFTVTASYPNVNPMLQNQERTMALQEKKERIISGETYRERALGLSDETKERKRLDEETVREHPAVADLRAEQIARGMGLPPGTIVPLSAPAPVAPAAPTEAPIPEIPSAPIGPDGQPVPTLGG